MIAPGASARSPISALLLLAASAGTLFAHALVYRFVCDDAFIAFRYARHLALGHGLTFNPGVPPVEGYTSLLWVLMLAATERVGFDPVHVSFALSAAASVAILGLVLHAVTRRADGAMARGVFALLFLSICRSFAVWTTGGLETRLHEALLLATLLLVTRGAYEGTVVGGRVRLAAAIVSAAAVWTRPETLFVLAGISLSGSLELRRAGMAWRPWLRQLWAPPLAAALAQSLFRAAYYHDWLPNTYRAKVAGLSLAGWGATYVGGFLLEYGVVFWVPIVVWRVWATRREEAPRKEIVLVAAMAMPILGALWTGGDHFEYRSLDLIFPLAAIVLANALLPQRRIGWRSWVAGAVVLFLSYHIPLRTHQEFPIGYYSGFPGEVDESSDPARRDFLDPTRDPLDRIPGADLYLRWHRGLVRKMTAHFVGVRQEEHAAFAKEAGAQAMALRGLVASGRIPADLRIATDCIGAAGYFTGLPILDRHGLTDAVVARRPMVGPRLLAHDRIATIEDARRFGVEWWAVDPFRFVLPLTSPRILFAATRPRDPALPVFAAPVGRDSLLLIAVPDSSPRALARSARIGLRSITDPTFLESYRAVAIPLLQQKVRELPSDAEAHNALAYLLASRGDWGGAAAEYSELSRLRPSDPRIWLQLADARFRSGDVLGSEQLLIQLARIARSRGDAAVAAAAEGALRRMQREPAKP